VIVWAVRLLTVISMQALFNFEVVRMELLFFPAMTVGTFVLVRTSVFVGSYEALCMPVLTHVFRIVEDAWLSSIILPIMSINTDVSFMIVFSVGTPHCLEVEKIEIHVWLKLLYQLY
jgi:hypothetical protein